MPIIAALFSYFIALIVIISLTAADSVSSGVLWAIGVGLLLAAVVILSRVLARSNATSERRTP